MKSKGNAIIIGIIIGLVVAFCWYYINNYLNPPRPIWVVQPGTSEFCPSSLYFSYPDSTSSFSINYLKSGSQDANYQVAISSMEVLSKYSTDTLANYSSFTTITWFLTKGSYGKYDFQLKVNDSSKMPNNITISTSMKCYYMVGSGALQTNLDCGLLNICCYYTKSGYSSSYNFAGEKC